MKSKPLRLPHTLVLIYVMVVLTVIATWIIPGGEYQRVQKGAQTVPVAGSYHRVASEPQGLGGLLVSPTRGFIDAAAIIAILFIVGGAFNVIQQTGAITAVIRNITFTFGRKKTLRVLLIPVVMLIFSLGGGVWGMCEETMPFILIFVPLALSLGYDTIVGVAMCFVGAAAGFAGAFFNPFTVGIAQGIAGLPMYSGLGYRLIVWACGTAIAIAVVMRYAARVRRTRAQPDLRGRPGKRKAAQRRQARPRKGDPHEPPMARAPRLRRRHGRHRRRHPQVQVVHPRDRRGVPGHRHPVRFVGGSREIFGKAFVDGAKDMINAALIIGSARAILVVATDGRILDTILAGMAGAISQFHPVISAEIMFVSQCIINFFVHSGTAQAALTIPIMAPLGDLVGITRQTSVFAFQLAEYINPVLPTSGVTMGVLGLAGLRWEKWARWIVPLLVLWILFAALALIPPVLMKWGPT